MKILLLAVLLLFTNTILAQNITGILGAFPPELVLLESQMTNKTDTTIQRIRFVKGELRGQAVVLAQTGIGKVNAAIATTLLIEHFKPKQILFSGIAGGIDPALFPGDIVIGTQIAYHDYGAIDDQGMHYTPTKNPSYKTENPVFFKCDSTLLQKAIATSKTVTLSKVNRGNISIAPTIKEGIIITGDVFVASENVTKRLRQDLNASATEMEGAAIAQTCYQQGIPFLIIRSLSDNANQKAAIDVKSFYQIAAENAAILVMAIVEKI